MIAVAPHLKSIVDPDGAVILDIAGDSIITLNATGAYIWKLLEHGMEVEMIIAALAQDTGADKEIVRRDVHAFLSQLESKHLMFPVT